MIANGHIPPRVRSGDIAPRVRSGDIAPRVRNAAFGDSPGQWPLPAGGTAEELWLRAVAAGGQGRYANANADLESVRRAHRIGRLASLAHSTHASFLRQLG